MNDEFPLKELLDVAILKLTLSKFAITGFKVHPDIFNVEWNERFNDNLFMVYRNIPIYLSKYTPINSIDFIGYYPEKRNKSIEGIGS